MSETGTGEFAPPHTEQPERTPVDDRFDQVFPDDRKSLMAEVGIDTGVRAVLGRSMELQPPQDGKLADVDKAFFDRNLGQIYVKIEESEIDDAKKDQARELLTDFLGTTDVPGAGTLEQALGYSSQEDLGGGADGDRTQRVERTEGDEEPDAKTRLHEALKHAGMDKEDPALDALVTDIEDLQQKTEKLTDAEIKAIQDRWSSMNVRKSHAKEALSASGLSEEEQKKILDGMTEKTSDELHDEEVTQDEADSVIKDATNQLQDVQESMQDIPDGPQKENLRAMLARWNLKLEEMKVKKVARGLFKGAIIAAIAFAVLVVGYMNLINKAAKKK